MTINKPSIRDVAKLAGVSVSVASNALNDKGRVNIETSARVKEAAQSLGYVPNYFARQLRGEGGAIGVVFTDTLEDIPLERFVGESLYAFYHLTYELGYKLHRIHLPVASFNEDSLWTALNDGTINAAVFVAPRISQAPIITRVMRRLPHLPYIYFSASPDLPQENYIDSDGADGMTQAVRHLLAQGHTRIAYLMPSDGSDQHNALDRLRGARAEMARAGFELAVYSAARWQENLSLDEIQADHISALIAWNDLLALRVIGQLNRAGLRVPEDVAVIGFDDEMFSRWTYPTITTLAQPIAEMGKTVIDYLVAGIKTGERAVLRKKFPVRLIVRESG